MMVPSVCQTAPQRLRPIGLLPRSPTIRCNQPVRESPDGRSSCCRSPITAAIDRPWRSHPPRFLSLSTGPWQSVATDHKAWNPPAIALAAHKPIDDR
jgi:hypothetical protein